MIPASGTIVSMTIEERPLALLCDGLRLRAGAYVPAAPRGLVVLFHGIPSTAPPEPGDEGYPGLARHCAEQGWATVWAQFRAAHGSPGYFSIEGWVRDARAVIDSARTIGGATQLRLAVVGSSAGGAVAVEAVARGAPVDALALLAAPAQWTGFAGDPAAGVRRITTDAGMLVAPEVEDDPSEWGEEFERVSTERSITRVKIPVLVVHGTADEVVPVDHAHRIAERSSRAELVVLEGADHRLRRDASVVALVLDWIGKTLG